eukprot:SAG31_NODE_138_length_22877_cov_29.540917_6_plen_150_part_00
MVISAAAAAVMGIVGTEILQYAKEKAQRLEDEKQRLAIKVDLDKLAVPPGHVEVTPDLLRLGFTGKGHFVKRQRRNKDREADKDLPPVPKWAYTGDIGNTRLAHFCWNTTVWMPCSQRMPCPTRRERATERTRGIADGDWDCVFWALAQ